MERYSSLAALAPVSVRRGARGRGRAGAAIGCKGGGSVRTARGWPWGALLVGARPLLPLRAVVPAPSCPPPRP